MVDLSRAARDLVAAATSQAEAQELKRAVEKTLDAFEQSPAAARNAAVRSIAKALPLVEGRNAQVLCLALGALVEGGAPPELVWPAVGADLHAVLDRATAFATAAVKQAKDRHVDTAIEIAGPTVARKAPEEANAWNALPSRCLTAVACLIRSKKVRAIVRGDVALQEAAWPLSDAVAAVGDLLQALRIVDDETLVVLAPELKRGWHIAIDSIASNSELYILLADALVGDPKKGRLSGKRPDRRAVNAIHSGNNPPASAASVVAPFRLLEWIAADHWGEDDHVIQMEGLPEDIPKWNGMRLVLLQTAPYERPIPAVPSFESLRPEVQIVSELSAAEVARAMAKVTDAATKLRSPKKTKAAKKTPPKTKTAKKKARRQ